MEILGWEIDETVLVASLVLWLLGVAMFWFPIFGQPFPIWVKLTLTIALLPLTLVVVNHISEKD